MLNLVFAVVLTQFHPEPAPSQLPVDKFAILEQLRDRSSQQQVDATRNERLELQDTLNALDLYLDALQAWRRDAAHGRLDVKRQKALLKANRGFYRHLAN